MVPIVLREEEELKRKIKKLKEHLATLDDLLGQVNHLKQLSDKAA